MIEEQKSRLDVGVQVEELNSQLLEAEESKEQVSKVEFENLNYENLSLQE